MHPLYCIQFLLCLGTILDIGDNINVEAKFLLSWSFHSIQERGKQKYNMICHMMLNNMKKNKTR